MSDLEHPLKKIKLATMEHTSTPHDTLDEKSLNLFSRQNAALGIDVHVCVTYLPITDLVTLNRCRDYSKID
jgi:hypothetical protein